MPLPGDIVVSTAEVKFREISSSKRPTVQLILMFFVYVVNIPALLSNSS